MLQELMATTVLTGPQGNYGTHKALKVLRAHKAHKVLQELMATTVLLDHKVPKETLDHKALAGADGNDGAHRTTRSERRHWFYRCTRSTRYYRRCRS